MHFPESRSYLCSFPQSLTLFPLTRLFGRLNVNYMLHHSVQLKFRMFFYYVSVANLYFPKMVIFDRNYSEYNYIQRMVLSVCPVFFVFILVPREFFSNLERFERVPSLLQVNHHISKFVTFHNSFNYPPSIHTAKRSYNYMHLSFSSS